MTTKEKKALVDKMVKVLEHRIVARGLKVNPLNYGTDLDGKLMAGERSNCILGALTLASKNGNTYAENYNLSRLDLDRLETGFMTYPNAKDSDDTSEMGLVGFAVLQRVKNKPYFVRSWSI